MYGNKTDIFIPEGLLKNVKARQDARFDAFLETNTGPDFVSPMSWLEEERESDIRALRIALEAALVELKAYESKPPAWKIWKK